MKRLLLLFLAGVVFLTLTGLAFPQCPQDTVDSGICDSLYTDFYDPRQPSGPPWEVHIPILVTHDVPDPEIDSLWAFIIPLKITHTNPTAYCSIPPPKNNKLLFGNVSNSIFRNFGGMENRMLALAGQGNGAEWDGITLTIQNQDTASYFWLSMIAMGADDQPWWEGSKTLLATITLRVQDSMTVTIDTCFWPPAGHLAFARADAKSYIPRDFMPISQRICFPTEPWFRECPYQDQNHNSNGHFSSGQFEAWGQFEDIIYCTAQFFGEGVGNVTLHYHDFMQPPGPIVRGHVEYDVIDHYKTGGYIKISIMDGDGEWDYCQFNVILHGCGDCNADGIIDVGDVVYLINYLYKNGDPPNPLESGDANFDGIVDVGDVVYLINYLFKGGTQPGS